MPIKVTGGEYCTTSEIIEWLGNNRGIGLSATPRTVQYLIQKGIIAEPVLRLAGKNSELLFPYNESLLALEEQLLLPPVHRKVGCRKTKVAKQLKIKVKPVAPNSLVKA